MQVARNVTMAGWGFLSDIRYLIHDRDSNFTRAFSPLIEEAGIKAVRLPIRSPNLNAFAERWIRSVKEECLSRLVLIGEASLRNAIEEYLAHFHAERNHQGLGNTIPFPQKQDRIGHSEGRIICSGEVGWSSEVLPEGGMSSLTLWGHVYHNNRLVNVPAIWYGECVNVR